MEEIILPSDRGEGRRGECKGVPGATHGIWNVMDGSMRLELHEEDRVGTDRPGMENEEIDSL